MIRRILVFALAFGVVAVTAVNAEAHARRDHHRQHQIALSTNRSHAEYPHAGISLITVHTAAGPITVNAGYANQFIGAVADLVAAGFRGRVNCFARGGHVRHSLHYTGEACDFAQLGRNDVAPGARIMYHAHAILARWGLRDGCSFNDCGHADTGRVFAATAHRSYAERGERRQAKYTQNAQLWDRASAR